MEIELEGALLRVCLLELVQEREDALAIGH
jgi:hypothetical protein